MRCQWVRRATFALASVVLLGGAVAAHHSQPGFSPNTKPIDLKGTVAEYRWRNPHVLFFFDVKDDKGNVGAVGRRVRVGAVEHRARHDQGHVQGRRRGDGRPAFRRPRARPRSSCARIVKADGTVIGGATE